MLWVMVAASSMAFGGGAAADSAGLPDKKTGAAAPDTAGLPGTKAKTAAPDTAALSGTKAKTAAPDTAALPGIILENAAVSFEELPDSAAAAEEEEVAVGATRNEQLSRLSREELFRRAFGRAAPVRPREMTMRLFDGEGDRKLPLGNVDIVWDEKFAEFRFISARFARHLDRVLYSEARPGAGDSVGYFTSTVLTGAGYVVTADEARHELRIIVPFRDKIQRRTLFGSAHRMAAGSEIDPARLSFYMNYRLDSRYTYSFYDYGGAYTAYRRPDSGFSRTPVYLDFEGALAALDWVLEGSALLREPAAGQPISGSLFQRGDVRAVHDFRELSSRLRVGDVSVYSEILGGDLMGGARYEHNGWLFGNDPRDGTDVVTFFLAKPGYVLVYVDGEYRERLELSAGHHEISGIDSRSGRSDVRLFLVTNDDRAAERVDMVYLYSSERNMFKNETRYSVTAGFRRDGVSEPWSYEYNFAEPGVHGDVMYGLHPALSVGLAGQFSRNNGALGTQFLWDMGKLGWIDLRAAASLAAYNHPGERVDVSYSPRMRPALAALNKLFTGDTIKRPLSGLDLAFRGYFNSGNYSEALFNPVVPIGTTLGSAGVSGNFGFGLFGFGVSASGGADFLERDRGGYYMYEYNYGLRLARSFGMASFNASAGEVVREGVRTPYFSLNCNSSLGLSIRRHRFSVGGGVGTRAVYPPSDSLSNGIIPVPDSYDLTYSANAGWRWSNYANGAGAQTYTANAYIRNSLNPSYTATADYAHNRAVLQASYSFSETGYANYSRGAHSLQAQLLGSFMYAGGLWAFGRQVNNGFALVDTKGDLEGANLHMNRAYYGNYDQSHTGLLGAAYHERVQEVGATNILLSATGVPMGSILRENSFHTMGRYKQGYALRVGETPTVLLQTRLMLGANPIAHAYLTIEPAGADTKTRDLARRASFTNSAGILQAGGLVPGASYIIKFGSALNLKDVTVSVPETSGALLDLGDIAVERE